MTVTTDLAQGEVACPVCGKVIPRRAGPGRPKVYCSTYCRNFAHWRRAIHRAEKDSEAAKVPVIPAQPHSRRKTVNDRIPARPLRPTTVASAFMLEEAKASTSLDGSTFSVGEPMITQFCKHDNVVKGRIAGTRRCKDCGCVQGKDRIWR